VEGASLSFVYLAALLFSISGLAILDFRFKLAIAKSARYLCLILISVVFFLIWDIAGIQSGIFFRGDASHLTGVLLTQELPLEEVFFLILLSYSSLLLLKAFGRREAKRSGGSK
jgi:lycopene cyclase domain-containing protein